MEQHTKLLSLMSLSKKAGKLKAGEFAVEEAVSFGKAALVIVAEDASENTKKKFSDKARYFDVPIVFFSTKEEIGAAIGKEFTASAAVCDTGLAKAFLDKYQELGR